MFTTKRASTQQLRMSDISTTLKKASEGLENVDLTLIEKDLKQILGDGTLSRSDALDHLSKVCNDKIFVDPQWSLLAGRIQIEMLYDVVPPTFSQAANTMQIILDPAFFEFVSANGKELDEMIRKDNDYRFDYFAVKTLRKTYLAHIKDNGKAEVVETPQYLYMRIAAFIHWPDLSAIGKMYRSLSNGDYSHATPTMFNAGMVRSQMGSCFLHTIGDSMDSISKSWTHQAIISQNGGGLGFDLSQLRHSEIGHRGSTRGIVPWAKIAAQVLEAVDQGDKRRGSGTAYLNICHADIREFVDLRDEGPEEMRAKTLFLGVMVSDLFMRRVQEDKIWSLFCPNKARDLFNKWGVEFEIAYAAAEEKKIYSSQVRARELWNQILGMQIKKGMPFIVYMDAINGKCNQKHSGMVRCSNLCVEIGEITSDDEIASCNLASVCLNRCIEFDPTRGLFFNFDKLEELVGDLVVNLNSVIDRNYYPDQIPQIKNSNLRHRPLGIGVQGLADTFALLDITWVVPDPEKLGEVTANPAAKKLNDQIFETIYFAAIRRSMELAKKQGFYESFPGSPTSKGQFQFDLWDEESRMRQFQNRKDKSLTIDFFTPPVRVSRYAASQWENLRRDMMTYGLRNSLLVALMPTASSAHILGNTEAFECFGDLISTRTVLSGQFVNINKHLFRDFNNLGLWNNDLVQHIIENSGSIQNLPTNNNPKIDHLKLKYRTVFEIPPKVVVELAADRARYVCQTQSMNCFMGRPTKQDLTAYHFYGWNKGLKTGMYYLRQKALVNPINFAKAAAPTQPAESKKPTNVVCTDEVCTACSS